MNVFLIRHGESETNKNGLWTGWLDAPLTEKGKKEAERVGGLLSGISFDKIYSSDLLRARTTAEIALPERNYVTTAELREINVGNIAGKPLSAVTGGDGRAMNEDGYKVFGGESNAEFGDRVGAFFKHLEGENCESIAVFSHAGFLRKALDIVLGIEVPHNNMLCKNCTVAVFEYSDNAWKLNSWINSY